MPGITYRSAYVQEPYAKTYVTDMTRAFIHHPAVELEADIDRVRLGAWPSYKPLRKAWGRQTTPLVIADIDALLAVVEARARERIDKPLPAGSWVAGQAPPLK